MAGGLLVLLGMDSRLPGPVVGGHLATGMHGGELYVRGEIEPWRCGKDVAVFPATAEEMEALGGVLADCCAALAKNLDEVLAAPFVRVRPASLRPYSELYTSL